MRFLYFLSFLLFCESAFAGFFCAADMLMVEIRSTPQAGNQETGRPEVEGAAFLTVNGIGIGFFRGDDSPCDRTENGCVDQVDSSWGCLPKRYLYTDRPNVFRFNITNVNPNTYVNLYNDVILSPRTPLELYLWKNLHRVGTYPSHHFVGEKEKSFSYLVLTSQDGAAIGRVQTSIRDLIDKAKSYLELHSKYWNEIIDLENRLGDLLHLNLLEIDLSTLDAPDWFKDLIRNARESLDKAQAERGRKLSDLEKEATRLSDEAKKILEEANIDTSEHDLVEHEELKDDEEAEDDDYPEDNEYSRSASETISSLTEAWNRQDRIDFVQVFYNWQQIQKTLASALEVRIGVIKGEWEAFQLAHNRVMAAVRQYMDDRLYFHSSGVPETTKDAIDTIIMKRSPTVGQEIKKVVNTLPRADSQTLRVFGDIEELARGYQDATDAELPFWDRLGRGLSAHIKQIASAAGQVLECVSKSMVAGPYADFYELRHGKSFCTDAELDSVDLAMAGASLSISAGAVILGGPLGSGAASSLTRGVKWLKSFFSRTVQKFSSQKVLHALGITEKIIESAKKFNITQKGMKAYTRIYEAVDSLPPGLKVKRIREGLENNKIAVVGRSMGNQRLQGVNDVAQHMKTKGIDVEIFNGGDTWDSFVETVKKYRTEVGDPSVMLPNDLVVKTDLYKANKAWANKLKEQGYTVMDIGDPNGLNIFSPFYSLEKSILFRN